METFGTRARFFRLRAVSRLSYSGRRRRTCDATLILGGAVVLYRDMGFEVLHTCANETVAFFMGWGDGLSYDAST
jgi:hypothetical protein